MKKNRPTYFLLRNLLTAGERRKFFVLGIFSLFISLIESLGIGVILPFLRIALDLNFIHENWLLMKLFVFFNFQTEVGFLLFLGVFICIFFLLRALLSIFHEKAIARFSMNNYEKLITRLLGKYLDMSYYNFVSTKRSEFSKTIISESFMVSTILRDALTTITDMFMIMLLAILILYIDWQVALAIAIALTIKAVLISKKIQNQTRSSGKKRASSQSEINFALSRVLDDFKYLKLQNVGSIETQFHRTVYNYTNALCTQSVALKLPKIYLETFVAVFTILAIMYFSWDTNGGFHLALPAVGIITLCLFRILPALNRTLSNYQSFVFRKPALDTVTADLSMREEQAGNDPILFQQAIRFKDVSFSYNDHAMVIEGANFSLLKSQKLAIVGASGAGKSTFIDILSGLLLPTKGQILIDDQPLENSGLQTWRTRIAYVPQHIFLFDGTVAENICWNSHLDKDRLVNSLHQAGIWEQLEDLDGIDTLVGDAGIKLSGGQRQRIALARALYDDSPIIIFDEATSALDNSTENNIIDNIGKSTLGKTVIFVTHSKNILRLCDRVFHIGKGRVEEVNLEKAVDICH